MTEPEKITLNISPVDLGHIDLLVEEGFYSNRSDFIRTAIRNLLTQHAGQVESFVTRRSMTVGACGYNRKDLLKVREMGEQIEMRVVGVLHLADDITPDLALATISSVKVLGVLHAPPEVRAVLAEAGRIL